MSLLREQMAQLKQETEKQDQQISQQQQEQLENSMPKEQNQLNEQDSYSNQIISMENSNQIIFTDQSIMSEEEEGDNYQQENVSSLKDDSKNSKKINKIIFNDDINELYDENSSNTSETNKIEFNNEFQEEDQEYSHSQNISSLKQIKGKQTEKVNKIIFQDKSGEEYYSKENVSSLKDDSKNSNKFNKKIFKDQSLSNEKQKFAKQKYTNLKKYLNKNKKSNKIVFKNQSKTSGYLTKNISSLKTSNLNINNKTKKKKPSKQFKVLKKIYAPKEKYFHIESARINDFQKAMIRKNQSYREKSFSRSYRNSTNDNLNKSDNKNSKYKKVKIIVDDIDKRLDELDHELKETFNYKRKKYKFNRSNNNQKTKKQKHKQSRKQNHQVQSKSSSRRKLSRKRLKERIKSNNKYQSRQQNQKSNRIKLKQKSTQNEYENILQQISFLQQQNIFYFLNYYRNDQLELQKQISVIDHQHYELEKTLSSIKKKMKKQNKKKRNKSRNFLRRYGSIKRKRNQYSNLNFQSEHLDLMQTDKFFIKSLIEVQLIELRGNQKGQFKRKFIKLIKTNKKHLGLRKKMMNL